MFKLSTLAAAAALMAASAAQAQVTFNANIELDPTHTLSHGSTTSSTTLGGRVEVNAESALVRDADRFVNARASLIMPVNGDKPSVDDLWLSMGNASADFKLGRFEAIDLFPVGMDTVVTKANGDLGYMANKLRGRVSNKFHGALGSNLAQGLRAELGVVAENASADGTSDDFYGVRPALVYTAGDLSLRAGVEALSNSNNSAGTVSSSTGYGLSLGYKLTAGQLFVNHASNSKLDANSTGINFTLGAFGVGYLMDETAGVKGDTVYLAYKMPLMGLKNAWWTPALSYSKADNVSDAVTALRVRLNYGF